MKVSSFFNVTGIVTIGSGGQQVGILDIAAGSELGNFGPVVRVDSGGILNINGGVTGTSLELNELTVSGTINFNGGTPLSVIDLTISGGVIASTSELFVTSFRWFEGTLLGQGTVQATTMNILGSGFKFLDRRLSFGSLFDVNICKFAVARVVVVFSVSFRVDVIILIVFCLLDISPFFPLLIFFLLWFV